MASVCTLNEYDINNLKLFEACSSKNYELAKWILDNTLYNTGIAFRIVCNYSYTELAIQLLNSKNININYDNDFAFRITCARGNITLAKHLLSIPNNNINISAKDDYAFRIACDNNHINIAQWLLSIPNNNINISAKDDYAFRYACDNDHIEMANWLCTLDSRYNIIIVNNIIISHKIIDIFDQINENINNVDILKKLFTCITLSEPTQCPICMDHYNNKMISLCGFHYYCIECLKKTNKNNCPMQCKNKKPILCL